jgi:hypothetical protein
MAPVPATPRGCTNFRLRQVTRRVTQHFDRPVGEAGLKTTQYSLLTHLERLGPVRPVDLARAMSMGKLHHAMMGTASVAIATAAAVPGTLVNKAAGGGERNVVRFGHPSGTLRVGAEASKNGADWVVKKAIMSRSARVLMEGWIRVPGDFVA